MNFDLVVKNGVVYTEQGFYKLNVGVQGEKIAVLADPAVPLGAQGSSTPRENTYCPVSSTATATCGTPA